MVISGCVRAQCSHIKRVISNGAFGLYVNSLSERFPRILYCPLFYNIQWFLQAYLTIRKHKLNLAFDIKHALKTYSRMIRLIFYRIVSQKCSGQIRSSTMRLKTIFKAKCQALYLSVLNEQLVFYKDLIQLVIFSAFFFSQRRQHL